MWLLLRLEQVQVRRKYDARSRKYDARSCVLAQLCVVRSTSPRPSLEAGHLVLGLVFDGTSKAARDGRQQGPTYQLRVPAHAPRERATRPGRAVRSLWRAKAVVRYMLVVRMFSGMQCVEAASCAARMLAAGVETLPLLACCS